MIFIETETFTEDINSLLDDDEYAALQQFLADQPDAGERIEGTGGLRKIRWAMSGHGKRGGIRVIYFHRTAASEIRFLLAYRKGIKDDLTAREKAVLRAINRDW